MFQIEEIRGPANVVVIQMGKRHNVKAAFARRFQIFRQDGRQVTTSVVLVIWVSGVCIVEENLSAIVQVDTAAISIPQGKNVTLCTRAP
ncbi:MAG TPA: hypothetical protein VJX30_02850 [Terriglobales bacterium]|nr:hypothetical protein [Terriglobales bacterium]